MKYIYILVLFIGFGCKPDTANKATNDTANEKSMSTKEAQEAQKLIDNYTKQNPKITNATPVANGKKPVKTNYNKFGIPDACDLLSINTVAKIMKPEDGIVNPSDGSSTKSPKSRACFYKWQDEDVKNAGVMISIQKNPVQEDVPDYLIYLIDSKISDGEKDFQLDETHYYKSWDAAGDAGAYSTELGKYLWRVGSEYSFMLAFNAKLTDKQQLKAARTISKEVMQNFATFRKK